MTKRELPESLPTLYRSVPCEARLVRADGAEPDAADDGTAPIELAISSETPVERWFGQEILEHSATAIDMTFAERGMALLVGHDHAKQIGIVRDIALGKDRVLRGKAYFSRTEEAQRIRQDILDGIRPYTSVGYSVREYVQDKAGKQGETYRATKWMPGEVSTVAVPADPAVGVGRAEGSTHPVTFRTTGEEPETNEQESRNMKPEATPDTDATRAAAAAEEQQRAVSEAVEKRNKEVAEITQLAIAHGCAERAGEFIASGKSAGEIALQILEAKRSQPLHQPPAERAPGILTDASKRPEYSLARAIHGATQAAEGGRWGGFEAECHEQIRKSLPASYKTRGGVLVPEGMGASAGLSRAMARLLNSTRAGLDTASANAGADLVYNVPADFIDLLRPMSVCVRMGATVLAGLSSPISFSKQTAAGSATWVGENPGSDVSESDLDTGIASMSGKTLMSTTSMSRQLVAQSSYDVEALVRRDLAAVHALAWDKAAIHGSGSSNEPTGIYAAADVNSKAMGGAVAFGELVDMATEVALDNALFGSTGFVTTPGMAGKLMQVLEFDTAGARAIWTGTHDEGRVAGYRAISSNQISSTMNGSNATGGSSYGIVFGNWADLLIGTWGALEIVVDPYAKKKQGMIEVTSFQLCDTLVRRGQSFCKATGATLA